MSYLLARSADLARRLLKKSDPLRRLFVARLTAFSDNFDRAQEIPIASPWESGLGVGEELSLVDNIVIGNDAAFALARLIAPAFASDQRASVTIGNGLYGAGPAVRIDENGNGYGLMIQQVEGNEMIQVAKFSTGVLMTFPLEFYFGEIGTLQPSTALELEVRTIGGVTTLSAYVNGVFHSSAPDLASPILIGQPGMVVTNLAILDTFSAADL